MQRPESIWVGPFLINVSWDAGELSKQSYEADMPQVLGLSDATNLFIVMDDRLPEPKARDTLLHEVLHLILNQVSFRNVENPTEEFIVDAIATHMIMLLRTNPDLVAYLVGSTDPTERTYLDKLADLIAVGEENGEEGES